MSDDYLSQEAEITERVAFFQKEARALMACELHDALARKLTNALLLLQAFRRQCDDRLDAPRREALQRVIGLLDDSLRDARRLLHDWQPPAENDAVPSIGDSEVG